VPQIQVRSHNHVCDLPSNFFASVCVRRQRQDAVKDSADKEITKYLSDRSVDLFSLKSVNRQIEMDNLSHVLDGYDLYFILIFTVLELWLIQA